MFVQGLQNSNMSIATGAPPAKGNSQVIFIFLSEGKQVFKIKFSVDSLFFLPERFTGNFRVER